jgi:hypothetical protein
MTDARVSALALIGVISFAWWMFAMIVGIVRRSRERLAKEESVAARVRHPMQPNGWGDDEVTE